MVRSGLINTDSDQAIVNNDSTENLYSWLKCRGNGPLECIDIGFFSAIADISERPSEKRHCFPVLSDSVNCVSYIPGLSGNVLYAMNRKVGLDTEIVASSCMTSLFAF